MSTKPLAHQVMPGANGAESAAAAEGAVRARDSLFHWCGTVDAIRETADRAQKRALLGAYFEAVAEETIGPAARFFAGAFLPAETGRPSRIEWATVADVIGDLARIDMKDLRARAPEPAELGEVAADVFAGRLPSGIAVSEVGEWSDALARARTARRRTLLREMLARVSSLEARYLVRLMTGYFDIGVEPADVDAAVSARFSQPEPRRGVDRRRSPSQNPPPPGQAQRRRRSAS